MDSVDRSWLQRLGVEQANEKYIFTGCERWKLGGEEDLAFLYSSSELTLVSCSDEIKPQLDELRLISLHDYVEIIGHDVLEVYIDDVDYYLPNQANRLDSSIPIDEVTIETHGKVLKQFLTKFNESDIEKADFDLDSDRFYIAYSNNAVSGVIASYCGVEPYESLSVLVDPAFRGQGVGKALVSFWAKEVESRNRVARYRTNAENTPSIKLCESVGFKSHSRIQVLAKL